MFFHIKVSISKANFYQTPFKYFFLNGEENHVPVPYYTHLSREHRATSKEKIYLKNTEAFYGKSEDEIKLNDQLKIGQSPH